MKDLVVLVEGKADKKVFEALLVRSQALNIRTIEFEVFDHPQSGAGCLNEAAAFFRAINASSSFQYALVVFDREGCGRDNLGALELESIVLAELEPSGWENRCASIVIEPELEVWLWSNSPQVDEALGWANHDPPLQIWLRAQNYTSDVQLKPRRPKETLEKALREVRKPYSASIHSQIAANVSLRRCTDESFNRLKRQLKLWFPKS